ncbi:MAG: hypothetical protein ACRDK3_00165 [Actinomycetota bacterium]
MKNQYFGDINDYVKYGLLRVFSATHRVAVCWMLTGDDGGTDGRLIGYLGERDRYRSLDPPLFDALCEAIACRTRDVGVVVRESLIPRATYHADLLTDHGPARDVYFHTLWERATSHDLIFFDPDNGLEVASVPKGKRNSAKFLYLDELNQTYERGFSVVVYQHFPRVPRTLFLERTRERIQSMIPEATIDVLQTARVAFVIVSPPARAAGTRAAVIAAADRWAGLLAGGGNPDVQAAPSVLESRSRSPGLARPLPWNRGPC